MNISIKRADDGDELIWETFVKEHPFSTYCHKFQWKRILENSYGLEAHFLLLYRDTTLIGVFPASICKKSPLGRKQVVSLSFNNYGGLLCQEATEPQELLVAVLAYFQDKGLDKVEIREKSREAFTVPSADESVTLIKKLSNSSEHLWKDLGAKVRNQIRKAEKSGLSCHQGKKYLDDFYKIYAKNMRRLGTPVHHKRYFEQTLKHLPSELLVIKKGEKSIAAMLLIQYKEVIADPFASSLPGFNHLNPNMLMYWEAIKLAIAQEISYFDFGRSPYNSGSYHFKKQWGCQAFNLNYMAYVNGQAQKSHGYKEKKLMKIFSNLWRYLPYKFSLILGPSMRVWLP